MNNKNSNIINESSRNNNRKTQMSNSSKQTNIGLQNNKNSADSSVFPTQIEPLLDRVGKKACLKKSN